MKPLINAIQQFTLQTNVESTMATNNSEKLITIRSDAFPVDPKKIEVEMRRNVKELFAKCVEASGAVIQVGVGRNDEVEEVAVETGLPERAIRAWRERRSGSRERKGQA